MRELTSHRVNGCNDQTTITVGDEPGDGGACHLYTIAGFNTATNRSDPFQKQYGTTANHATILFQNGPIPEVGVNGVTHEQLLAILIDRMEGFQAGEFACPENATALFGLQSAQAALKSRTEQRIARGVEGTHQQ